MFTLQQHGGNILKHEHFIRFSARTRLHCFGQGIHFLIYDHWLWPGKDLHIRGQVPTAQHRMEGRVRLVNQLSDKHKNTVMLVITKCCLNNNVHLKIFSSIYAQSNNITHPNIDWTLLRQRGPSIVYI